MTNIYVGNLDFATHEDQLQTLFAASRAPRRYLRRSKRRADIFCNNLIVSLMPRGMQR